MRTDIATPGEEGEFLSKQIGYQLRPLDLLRYNTVDKAHWIWKESRLTHSHLNVAKEENVVSNSQNDTCHHAEPGSQDFFPAFNDAKSPPRTPLKASHHLSHLQPSISFPLLSRDTLTTPSFVINQRSYITTNSTTFSFFPFYIC